MCQCNHNIQLMYLILIGYMAHGSFLTCEGCLVFYKSKCFPLFHYSLVLNLDSSFEIPLYVYKTFMDTVFHIYCFCKIISVYYACAIMQRHSPFLKFMLSFLGGNFFHFPLHLTLHLNELVLCTFVYCSELFSMVGVFFLHYTLIFLGVY